MKLYINDTYYENEIKTFLKVYIQNESIEVIKDINNSDLRILTGDALSVQMLSNDALYTKCYTKAALESLFIIEKLSDIEIKRKKKLLLKQLIYDIFNDVLDIRPPWGVLTGIRPTKIVLKLLKESYSIKSIREILLKDYRISEEKIDLMLRVVNKEIVILDKNREKEISLYIGIPFCPSKCYYCSFTSYSIDKYRHFVEAYISALKKEIESFRDNILPNYNLRTIYIGGGTPTSLNESQLKVLMKCLSDCVDLTTIDEFTVEAGRPDTITREKLEILKSYGVNRISINPQTMNDSTLKLIGRNHTVKDIRESFSLAKEIGFETINMDLILGLDEETVEDVANTLNEIEKLNPENVTIHTLAIKRASRLKEDLSHYHLSQANVIENMLSASVDKMNEMNLYPYYLYRQKNILGNFENVGYAKKGHDCIYNVEIIEEKSTIYAIGAGAATKVVNSDTGKINRIENVKNVEQYIERIDEMMDRKFKGMAANN